MFTSALPTPRHLVPDPGFAEFHRRAVDADPAAAARALQEVTCRDVRVLAPLLAVRELPMRTGGGRGLSSAGDRPLRELFAQGFDILAAGPDGYLFAAVEQPFRLRGGERRPTGSIEEFRAFDEPGFCRIAADFRVTVRAGRTVVSTETVVDCTDPATHRAFARYWLLIRPFSGLIRRGMLAAVDRRATAA